MVINHDDNDETTITTKTTKPDNEKTNLGRWVGRNIKLWLDGEEFLRKILLRNIADADRGGLIIVLETAKGRINLKLVAEKDVCAREKQNYVFGLYGGGGL